MPSTLRIALVFAAVALATLTLVAVTEDPRVSLGTRVVEHEARYQPAVASTLKNPLKSSPASIAEGKKVFEANCTTCHGSLGKGDGKMAAELNPKPADLSAGQWKHGSSDGELFTTIRNGVKDTGMKGFASKLTANQIWNVVNYVRTLGPTRSQ